MPESSVTDEDFPPRASAFGAWTGLESPTLWAKPIEREGLCVMSALKGKCDALKQQLRAQCGLEPSGRLENLSNGETTLVAMAPDAWLIVKPGAERYLATELRQKFEGVASVMDQSGAYARLRIGGADAAKILQKGAFIDLAAFGPGSAATTHIAHLGVIIWRAGADEVFDIAMFRSTARDFLHWLEIART